MVVTYGTLESVFGTPVVDENLKPKMQKSISGHWQAEPGRVPNRLPHSSSGLGSSSSFKRDVFPVSTYPSLVLLYINKGDFYGSQDYCCIQAAHRGCWLLRFP